MIWGIENMNFLNKALLWENVFYFLISIYQGTSGKEKHLIVYDYVM